MAILTVTLHGTAMHPPDNSVSAAVDACRAALRLAEARNDQLPVYMLAALMWLDEVRKGEL